MQVITLPGCALVITELVLATMLLSLNVNFHLTTIYFFFYLALDLMFMLPAVDHFKIVTFMSTFRCSTIRIRYIFYVYHELKNAFLRFLEMKCQKT